MVLPVEGSFLTAVFLPLALFVIMLGMGLGLKPADFSRLWQRPLPVLVGLAAQLVLLPLIGFGLAVLLPLTPELAVGLMLIAACPGGPTSNMITYLAKGNVALSITLTALSSLITIITIPLIVNAAAAHFLGAATALQLPLGATITQLAVITLIPTSLGMAFCRYAPAVARRLAGLVKWLSLLFLGLIIVGLLVQQRQNVLGYFGQVGTAVLLLNAIAMILGLVLARGLRLATDVAHTIAIEVGIQNGTLAIAIATTFLNAPVIAIPAAIYSLIMFVSGGLIVLLVNRPRAA